MPTSVGTIQDCVSHAFNPSLSEGEVTQLQPKAQPQHASAKMHQTGECSLTGGGLNSQGDWEVEGILYHQAVQIRRHPVLSRQ